MEPALTVAVLWLLFGGTHLGLAAHPARDALGRRLGEMGFLALYSVIAAVSFAILVHGYAVRRALGVPGLALGGVPGLRPLLVTTAGAGIVLALLMSYPRSPTALFGQPIGAPYGIERITRHPFFAGMALFAVAHTLLATRLTGTVFFAGLATLAIAGARHQDRKLLARRGAPYAEYLAATSAIPFAAVVGGRQRLVWREISWAGLAGAVLAAVALRLGHGALFAHDGAWVTGAVLAGAVSATFQSWRRSRRVGALAPGVRPARPAGSAP